MNKKHIIISFSLLALFSCKDEVIPPEVEVPQQSENVATMLTQHNANIAALQYVSEGQATVVALTDDGKVTLDNSMELALLSKAETDADIPAFGIDEEGYWKYILNGDTIALTDLAGNAVPALKKAGQGTYTPQVSISEDGYWQMSINGYQWKKLSDKMAPSLNDKAAESYALFKSTSTADGKLTAEPFIGSAITLELPADDMAEAWRRFIMKTDDNVLLDYSYAGYNYGESAPADGFAWGYTVKNIKDYLAPGVSDRQAFINILAEAGILATKDIAGEDGYKNRTKEANLVIYFPEGTYVLHNDDDNTKDSSKQQDAIDKKGNNVSTAIKISASNFIIKGDGAGKTIIKMETPNLPTDVNDTGSSPEMINIGHTNSPDQTNLKESMVSEDAAKGAYSVFVSDASWIKAGDWVQLRTRSDNATFVSEELGPIVPKTTLEGGSWSITESVANGGGVKITEFHKVKSVSTNKVTFYEPIMHEVKKDYNWVLKQYKYLYNVGIEGITFVGDALDKYSHHGDYSGDKQHLGWQYDGAYKPLVLSRVVNSWVRDVNFTSVSEALSINESANSSAYNITIDGTRGHSAVRAQHSTRVFIGKVNDISTGKDADGNPCNGQFHGCGVSKPSIGCVIWNSTWGSDACFESHATQPRATLFDNCSGGLVYYRAGGAEKENPNHLAGLTIWNLDVTGTDKHASAFSWWSNTDIWWKIYPPIVVGTHGENVTFADPTVQMTYEESTGAKVTPNSLYEAQLEKRLGYVPGWLKALK